MESDPTVCVDRDGNEYPEHDWSGDFECPRCGAELYEEAQP